MQNINCLLEAHGGVPPKQYEPEYEPRQSKYPVANLVKGSLSQEAQAFSTTIYSAKFPNTEEEAQKDEKQREAIQEEMRAVKKKILHGRNARY